MIPARILFLLLSLSLMGVIQSCSEEPNFCITLHTTSENSGADLQRDIDVLKTRLNKTCGSCIVTGSADLKNIQVCSANSEKDLLSEMLMTAHGKVEFLETFENAELYPVIDSINLFLATTSFAQAADSQYKKTGTPSKEFEDLAKKNPLFTFLTPAFKSDDHGTNTLTKGPVIGYCKAVDTSLVNQMMSLRSVRAKLPGSARLLWSKKSSDKEGIYYELVAVNENPLKKKLSNKNIKTVEPRKSDYSDAWEVYLNFDEDGSRLWNKMTRENIGRSLAICIDDKVYSYPTVQGEITGGASTLTGDFDRNEAHAICSILSSGELVSDFKIKN